MSGSKVVGAKRFQFRCFCLRSQDLGTEDRMRPGNGGWGGDILSALARPLTWDILLKIQQAQHSKSCSQGRRGSGASRPAGLCQGPALTTADDSQVQRCLLLIFYYYFFFFLIPLCAKVCLDPVLIHLVKPSAGIIPNVSNNKISRWKVLMHLKMQDKWKNNNTKAKTNKSRLLPASTSLFRLQPHPLVF